jgi:GMP reductase
MIILEDVKLNFSDVLIKPQLSSLSSRNEVILNREYQFINSKQSYHGVPIMAANMDGVGTYAMAEELSKHKLFTCLIKTFLYSQKEIKNFFNNSSKSVTDNVAISIGSRESDLKCLSVLYDSVNENKIKYVCIDVANGYSKSFVSFVRVVRKTFPEVTIIAGNVVTGEMTQELILNGADIVKVGVGPGSVCTTRIQTGVGYPQLSAIIECARSAHFVGGHIIADGGCTCPGDVAKAFGAGADFVMLGGMLAGTDEGGGDIIEEQHTNKKFVEFYGMSSDTAMNKHHGGVAEYRSSEGRTVRVPYRGPVKKSVLNILGGLRSTCTYVGAANLNELSKRTTFVRVTQQYNDIFSRMGN